MFNDKRHAKGKSKVVIYTFRGCKPCAVLAKELNRRLQKGELDAMQIIYINTNVREPDVLKEYLDNQGYLSPYYVKREFSQTLVNSYPRIEAFDTFGKKVWYKEGYSLGIVRKIKKHLKK